MSGLEELVLILVKQGAPVIAGKAKHSEAVMKVRQKLRLKYDPLPTDFTTLYKLALVEYGVGKESICIRFFADEYMRAAFKQSFKDDDYSRVKKEGARLYETLVERNASKVYDYDLTREIPTFLQIFERFVADSRSPAESQHYRLAIETRHDLMQALEDLAAKTEEMDRSAREARSQFSPSQIVPLVDEAVFVILATVPPSRMGPEYLLACARPVFEHPVLMEKDQAARALQQASSVFDSRGEHADPFVVRRDMFTVLATPLLSFDKYLTALRSFHPEYLEHWVEVGYRHASAKLGDYVAFKYLELMIQLRFYQRLLPILRERALIFQLEFHDPEALRAVWEMAEEVQGPDEFEAWKRELTHEAQLRMGGPAPVPPFTR